MTTSIATVAMFPRIALRFATPRLAKFAFAFLLAGSLMLNGYYWIAANAINGDLVEAGIVQAPTSIGLIDRLEMSVVADNVRSVAISAGQAAAAAQQLQEALVQMQAAAGAGTQ
jgi:hypothetical protein